MEELKAVLSFIVLGHGVIIMAILTGILIIDKAEKAIVQTLTK